MRSSTLKWIVLSATLLAALIITVQLYWLKKVYSFEERQFNINVVKSIRGLFEDLEMNDAPGTSLQTLINNPGNNYFLFKADTIPPKDSLSFYLQEEFADFGVLTDCKLGAYSSTAKKFVYEEFLPTPASRYAGSKPPLQELPVYSEEFDHILLYFPHRHEYILEQMDFWIVSSAILFIALIGLAISLFYFYRQKFLAEVQKDFVNNFTHEFKTPLAVMKIAAGVLAQDNIVHQPDRLERYTAIIKNQTEHLQSQVERLLNAASSESRNLSIRKENIDVGQLIEQALSKVQPLIEEKRAKVDLKMDEDNGVLHGDKAHLELAVVNLLENALKYAVDPHIVVETGNAEDDFFISVKDNGVGIEKKYIKNIFKKFYRVPTGDIHDVKGFGLGLNFVKRIIDAHNGKIKVNSLPGIGTEFSDYLFLSINHYESMQQVPKVKVLLAEDDLSLGYVIKDNLIDAGYEVVLCPDGQSAIDKFDKNEFDICLLDVMMPNKDGFAVAKKIRSLSDMVPILFLTARSMEEDKLKGFQSGADDYMTKPFSIQELLMRMEVFLRRTRKMHSEKALSFTIGKLNFSYTDLKLKIDKEIFNLTQKEADLLKFLCEHSNRILKREEVLLNVWGKDDYFLGRSMDVFITKLRKYFKADPEVNLETIHGVGFRFNTPAA